MKVRNTFARRRTETGIALLISIFILLLISVVAIALIVSSGTESALAGNYRSSTGVYYAALSGLEEARGRLLAKNPHAFKSTDPAFIPAPGTPFTIGSVAYVLNPGPTELMGNILTTYEDTEYDNEFGAGALAAVVAAGNRTTTASVWNRSPLNALNVPGPLYKWVRINAVSEKSLNIDVDHDTLADSITPLYYDGVHFSNSSSAGPQVLAITSLAALPNGSQKIVQYLVASSSLIMPPFPAAITLLGNNVDYTGPDQNLWKVSGNDTVSLGSCAPGGPVYAVGYYNSSDNSRNNINQGTFTAHAGNYTGYGGATPNLGPINMPATFRKPSQLDALAQAITQNADVVIPGPATGASLPSAMTPSNLMTVVVNGDLDLTGWHDQGYGLLLVTGNLTYDPDASWYGIVLLIGQGNMTGAHGGSGQFVGGLFLAKTRNSSGTLYPDPNLPNSNSGSPFGSNIQFSPSMGGQGVYYSSCWIQAALPSGQYDILSFHEISQ